MRSMILGKLASALRRLARDKSGVTAIEYVVIASGTAVLFMLALSLAGTDLSTMFGNVASTLTGTEVAAVDNSDSGESDSADSDDDSDSDFSSDDESSSDSDSESS